LQFAISASTRLVDAVCEVVRGKRQVVELAVAAMLARGHVLLEDIPGVGKTTLARTLAQAVGLAHRRVQFTSDLLPADLLGGHVIDGTHGELHFRPGPIFTQVLLADEINRTTPRTQSALLQAMEERTVTIEGNAHVLDPGFFVLATQNPHEFHGTYPLPESQLDRFLVCLRLGYADPEVERALLEDGGAGKLRTSSEAVCEVQDLHKAQQALSLVHFDASVLAYLHEIILATRSSTIIQLGASTRAALSLEQVSRALSLVRGHPFVRPDEVQELVLPVLAHRLVTRGAAAAHDSGGGRMEAEGALREILERVPVPT